MAETIEKLNKTGWRGTKWAIVRDGQRISLHVTKREAKETILNGQTHQGRLKPA